jgi:hypothetical protein
MQAHALLLPWIDTAMVGRRWAWVGMHPCNAYGPIISRRRRRNTHAASECTCTALHRTGWHACMHRHSRMMARSVSCTHGMGVTGGGRGRGRWSKCTYVSTKRVVATHWLYWNSDSPVAAAASLAMEGRQARGHREGTAPASPSA